MSVEDLIREVEHLVKSSRDNYTQGHTDAARLDLLTVAAKIIDTLLEPADQATPGPGNMRW